MAFLLKRYLNGSSTAFELGSRMVLIGSSDDCDIVASELKAEGGVAARIQPVDGQEAGYTVEPVGRNTVILNGKKTGKTMLAPGDRLSIGPLVLVFDCGQDSAAHLPVPCAGTAADMAVGPLAEFIESVGVERDVQVLLQRLMAILCKILRASDAFIFKLDAQGNPQLFVSTGNDAAAERFSDTIVQKVLADKKGVFIANALTDPAFSRSQSIADLKLSSVVCTPIMAAGATSGIIYAGSRRGAVSYTACDLSILSVYAALAGMLINHVEYIGQQSSAIRKLTDNGVADGFIAASSAMQGVIASINSLARSDITVLLEGPTGCGKNHVAEIIHKKSLRSGKPFLVVNCSSLRGELLESELFGHKKGSFTGAVSDQTGLFAAASGGTLVLDEIGELDLTIQAKLLRVLESGTIRSLGSAVETPVNVRVICATNRDLIAMTESLTFRRDLYYRINQFCVTVPPLADRGEDILVLAYFFLEKYKAAYPTRPVTDFHPHTLRFIQTYEWPGNIRELSNRIHRAMLSGEGPLLAIDIPPRAADPTFDLEAATQKLQKDLITRAIRHTGGNKEEAARLLGMSRSTFFKYQSVLGCK